VNYPVKISPLFTIQALTPKSNSTAQRLKTIQ